MTRINANIDPKTLHRRHLVAELREITMVPAALKTSLKTTSVADIYNKTPQRFTLNKGHVSFFYNKLQFLRERFNNLADEMERRQYKPDRTRIKAFDGFPLVFYGSWTPSFEDNNLVQQRINERIAAKKHLYTSK